MSKKISLAVLDAAITWAYVVKVAMTVYLWLFHEIASPGNIITDPDFNLPVFVHPP